MYEINPCRYAAGGCGAETAGGNGCPKEAEVRAQSFPNSPRKEAVFTGVICGPELADMIIYLHRRKRPQGPFL